MVFHMVEQCGLDAAEAEIVQILRSQRFARPAGQRPRKFILMRIAALGGLLHDRPARITEPEQLRPLVERLARRVVDGTAELAGLPVPLDQHQAGVAAGNHQRQQRIGRRIFQHAVRLVEERTVNMGDEVVHADQRLAVAHRQSLREREADQQRRNQSGALRHRDRADLLHGHARLAQSALHHRIQRHQVFARRQFGNHAAVDRMFGDLRRDATGQNLITVANHRRRGFIAAGLDSQNQTHVKNPPKT